MMYVNSAMLHFAVSPPCEKTQSATTMLYLIYTFSVTTPHLRPLFAAFWGVSYEGANCTAQSENYMENPLCCGWMKICD